MVQENRQSTSSEDDAPHSQRSRHSAASDGKDEALSTFKQLYQPTFDFVLGNVNDMEATIPYQHNVFDIYFDISVGGWISWKQVFLYIQEETKPEKTRKNMLQNVVQTQDYLRTSYIMERLLDQQYSTMLIGRTGVGKSIVIKNFLMTQDGVNKRTNIELMTFSFSSTAAKV